MDSNLQPEPNEKLSSLNQENFRRNPSAYGWNVKGWIYFTPASGNDRSYRVEYEATIAPWEQTRKEQIEQIHLDVPNELVEELLAPVREAVRVAVCGSLDKAGLQGEST